MAPRNCCMYLTGTAFRSDREFDAENSHTRNEGGTGVVFLWLYDVENTQALQIWFCRRGRFQEQSRYASRYFYAATRPYTRHPRAVPFLYSVGVTPTPRFFCWWITSIAAQKHCKRKNHVMSSTSSSTTTTQLPGTGTTISSWKGTLLNPDKLHSLYTRTSHRTRSASSSAISAPTTSSKESSQERRSETCVCE